MARKFLTPIDLTGLELQNFKVQNLSTNPSAYGKGHTYYNTTANELRTYNGTSWETVGGNVISGATGSRPAAGHAGRLYFDTTLNVLFFDNGNAWVQDGVSQSDLDAAISGAALGSTDDLSEGTTNLYFTTQRARDSVSATSGITYASTSGVFSANYTAIESQLVTDGFAKTSDIPSLEGYVTETGVETLSNKTFSGDTYFQSSGGAGGTNNYLSVNNGTGKFTVRSGYALDLSSSGDINIVSNGGDIVINPDGAAYIGSVSSNNQIATIGDINADLYVKSVSSPLAVDGSGNLTVDLTAYLTTSDASSTYLTQSDASSTYLSQSTASSTYLSQSDASSTYQTQSGLDSAVSGLGYAKTVDIPSAYITAVGSNLSVTGGTLDLGANVVITDSVQTLSNKTISDKLNFTGYTSPGFDGYIWTNSSTGALELWSEYDIKLSPSGIIDAVGTEAHATKIEFHLADDTNQGAILAHPSDGTLTVAAINQLHLESHNGSITLDPDTDVRVNSALYVTNGNNAYVSGGVVAGGADYEYDGYLQVKDYNGNNVFTVTADGNSNGGQAIGQIHGQLNVYRPGPGGNNVGQFYGDGDDNFIVNAYQNNLVLQSDNSNSVYLGSVAADNKVVKFSDLTALSSGLSWKQAANLLYDASSPVLTGDTVTSPLVIDGHAALGTAEAGVYRVLITNSDNAGIYLYNVSGTTWTLDRATDGDVYSELIGAAIFIEEGTNYGATSWVQNNHYITDFTGQTWVQFSGQGTYVGSNSILIDGNQVSVILDSDSLEITGSGLKVNYLTNNGLDNDGGLYVKTGTGLVIDNSGNVAINTEVVARKFSQDLTYSGSATSSFTVTHNLGTKHVQISVFEVATGEDVIVDTSRPTNNTVQIDFAVAPASGAYTVVVVG